MQIALFYLVDDGKLGVHHGGSISFTCHLYHSLRLLKHHVRLIRITKRSERTFRTFRPGVKYQNLSLAAATNLARSIPSMITFSIWKQYETEICTLLDAGSGIVVHDPAEFRGEFFDAISDAHIRPATIRKINRRALRKAGLDPIFIPHPYVTDAKRCIPIHKRPKHAVSLSRIDFRKHIEIIIDANKHLPEGKRVEIAGDENRRYTHFKLDVDTPGWREDHIGSFPDGLWAGVHLAKKYKFVVDMTEIKGDGGGTQYTFFEAWNAGCALVLNKAWLLKKNNVLEPDRHAIFVQYSDELAERLLAPIPRDLKYGGRKLLEQHSPDKVVPRVVKYLEGRKIGG